MPPNGQVLKEAFYPGCAGLLGRNTFAEEDIPANPLFIGLLSAPGIASDTDFIGQSNQQFTMIGAYLVQGPLAFAFLEVIQFLGRELPRRGRVVNIKLPGLIFPVFPVHALAGRC